MTWTICTRSQQTSRPKIPTSLKVKETYLRSCRAQDECTVLHVPPWVLTPLYIEFPFYNHKYFYKYTIFMAWKCRRLCPNNKWMNGNWTWNPYQISSPKYPELNRKLVRIRKCSYSGFRFSSATSLSWHEASNKSSLLSLSVSIHLAVHYC